jgi:hypothetical protein
MTSLGLGQGGAPKMVPERVWLTSFLRNGGILLGGAGMLAVVDGAYQVLKAEPEQGFKLLEAWGPAFLISIVAIFVMGKFLEGINVTVSRSFEALAQGVSTSAEAAGKTAEALTMLADQGSRQAEETRRLVLYAAQEFPPLYERLDRQDEAMRQQSEALKELRQGVQTLHSMLSAEKTALNKKERETEASDGS